MKRFVAKYQTLKTWARRLRDHGAPFLDKAFGKAPILVLLGNRDEQSEGLLTSSSEEAFDFEGTARFRMDQMPNMYETSDSEAPSPIALLTQGNGLVVPIRKSDRNPFVGVISVGRANNNDIRLVSTQVSKLHAFVKDPGDGWRVQDNGSKNGTFVNHLKVQPKQDHPLAPGDMVGFANVSCMFVDQERLISLCGMVTLD